MSTIEEDVQIYLQRHIAPVDWELRPPERGLSGAKCFIARSTQRTLFVKLGGDDRLIRIVSDAQLAPQLVAGGLFSQTRITVQEFVEGHHPTRQWYASHADTWAHLMHTLSQISILRDVLPPALDETYQSLLTRYIGQVRAIYNPANLSAQERDSVETLLGEYTARIPWIEGSGLVPIHGDPGPDNILIASTQVYLIDWDRLHLSDPMRDVALVAWWMYPRSHWQDLLDLFEIDLADTTQQERFYFYISVWSLEVALFFANAQQGEWKQRFLHDAQRSFGRQQSDHLLFT